MYRVLGVFRLITVTCGLKGTEEGNRASVDFFADFISLSYIYLIG
jgi:hypothetical protein